MTVMEAAKNLRESNSSYVSMLDSALPSFHYDYDLYHQKSLNSRLPQITSNQPELEFRNSNQPPEMRLSYRSVEFWIGVKNDRLHLLIAR